MVVFGSGGWERLAKEAGVAYIGAIPMDPPVRIGGDSGTPVTISHPESPVSLAFQVITEDLASKISVSAIQKSDFVPINIID